MFNYNNFFNSVDELNDWKQKCADLEVTVEQLKRKLENMEKSKKEELEKQVIK